MTDGSPLPPEELLSHAAFLRGIAQALLRDPDQAADVVQDTYLAAMEAGERPRAVRPWLGQVARNFARMRLRSEKRRARREEASYRPRLSAAAGDIAARTELQRRVASEVHALEEPYRTVIVLRYLEEIRTPEIARRLRVPPKTVQTRLRRGLALLRGRLDEGYGDRRSWAVLLLPLAFPTPATAAGGATALATVGAAIMKPKLALPLLLLLGIVGSIWVVRAHSRPSPAETTVRADLAQSRDSDPAPVAGTADEGPAAAPPRAAGIAYGVVRDESGAPIAGAVVTPGRWDTPTEWAESGPGVTTAGDGSFGLPTETGEGVLVTHAEYAPYRGYVSLGTAENAIVLERGTPVRVRVLSPDGAPIPGVPLRPWGFRRRGQVLSGDTLAPARSGADGRADLGRVPRGELRVYGSDERYPETVLVVDVDGPKLREFDLAFRRGGFIEGRVVDTAGQPVAGATVRVPRDEMFFLPREATADRLGRFRVGPLAAGWAELVAEAEGFSPANFGSVLGWEESIPVPVTEAESTTGVMIVLGRPVYVRGRLVDESGRGCGRAGVRAGTWMADQEATATTAASGRFRVGPLAAGDGLLVFESSAWRVDQVEFAAEPGAELDLGDITATTLGRLRGRAIDEEGRTVTAGRITTMSGGASLREDGTFFLMAVPGRVTLLGEGRGHFEGLRARAELDLAPGESRDGLELVFRSYEVIRGEVVRSDGTPLGSVWVGAVPPGAKEPFRLRDHPTAGSRADGSFELAVLEASAYRVGVLAVGADGARLRTDPPPERAESGGEPVRLVVAATEGFVAGRVFSEATHEPLRFFDTRLVEIRDGRPGDNVAESFEAPDGRFRRAIEPGTWALEIHAAGHGPVRTDPFTVTTGRTVERELTLPAAGRVSGTVRDADGNPAPYVRVALFGPGLESPDERPLTDLRGHFAPIRFGGTCTLVAFAPRHGIAVRRDVRVEPGRETRVEIHLPRPAPLAVAVRDEGGRPVAGARVDFSMEEIAPLDGELMHSLYVDGYPGTHYTTDARGELRVAFLPPGEIELRVAAPGLSPESRRLVLEAGAANGVEFTLR